MPAAVHTTTEPAKSSVEVCRALATPGKTPAATTLNSSSSRASQRINGTVGTCTAEMAVLPARFLFLRNIKVPLPNSREQRPLWTSQTVEATSFAS